MGLPFEKDGDGGFVVSMRGQKVTHSKSVLLS